MTDRELMQQALKALEVLAKYENPLTKIQVRKPRDGGPIVTMYPHQVATNAAELLRGRLAQPEQDEMLQVAEALRRVGLTLVRTTKGFDVMNLGQIEAQGAAQPAQEPHSLLCVCGAEWDIYPDGKEVLAATAPPRREWVGLTDREIEEIARYQDEHGSGPWHLAFARAIEAKLKEKNA